MLLVIVAALLVTACGGDDTPAPANPTATPAVTPSATATTIPEATEPAFPTTVTENELVPLAGFEVASDIVDNSLEGLVIQVGTTVTWTQVDGFTSHTSSADVKVGGAPIWDSPMLREGETFSHTFNEPGSTSYYCRIHPGIMIATVTVVEPVENGISSIAPSDLSNSSAQVSSDPYDDDY